MNSNKVRDFFSAYYEGTLDRAIRQTFEAKLKADSDLQTEYRAFEAVMRQLGSLKDQPVPVPDDLHETISARLDRHIYESKRRQTGVGLGNWWRTLVLGGAACAVLVAAVITLRNQPSGKTSVAGGVALDAPKPPAIVDANGTMELRYSHPKSSSNRIAEKLVVREGTDGKVLSETPLQPGLEVKQPLENRSSNPVLLTIEKGSDHIVVVIPGKSPVSSKAGTGSVEDLAKALSANYAICVEIAMPDLAEKAEWNFGTTNPLEAKIETSGRVLHLTQLQGSLYKLHQ